MKQRRHRRTTRAETSRPLRLLHPTRAAFIVQAPACTSGISLKAVGLDDRICKLSWRFLWQVVTDATSQNAMAVLAGELRRIRTGIRVRRSVGIPFERNARHGDRRARRELAFQIVVL